MTTSHHRPQRRRTRMANDLVGETLGRVELQSILGEGAMGVVYKGLHTTLGIPVAVKVLKSMESTRAETYRERFQHEARIAARLDHPGMVRVLDFGQEQGQAYLVMEFIEGFTLETYLRRSTSKGMGEVSCLRMLLSATLALASAHQAGIMHRDLKPSNMLLTRKGHLKIADLGLARVEDEPGMTRDNVILGSPAYMAPECVTPGSRVDHRCDIYSLGVVAYQIAFARLPYRGTVKEILHGHMAGSARFDLPHTYTEATINLIQAMMASDPQERPTSGQELARQIRAAINQAQLQTDQTTRRTRRRNADPGHSTTRHGTVQASHGGTTSIPGGGKTTSTIGEFTSLVRFMEGSSSTHNNEVIVHSTGRERFFILLGLIAIVAVAGIALSMAGVAANSSDESEAATESSQEASASEEASASGDNPAAAAPTGNGD